MLACRLVSVGIASTLIMIALSTGVRLEVQAVQEKTGRNLFIVKAGRAPRASMAKHRRGWYITTKLKREDTSLIRTQIPTINEAAPILERTSP